MTARKQSAGPRTPDGVAMVKCMLERDAAQAQVAALTSALNGLARDEMRGRENELGEDYVQCDRCDATAWGSRDTNEPEDIEHAEECPFRILADTDAAAREHDRRTIEAFVKRVEMVEAGALKEANETLRLVQIAFNSCDDVREQLEAQLTAANENVLKTGDDLALAYEERDRALGQVAALRQHLERMTSMAATLMQALVHHAGEAVLDEPDIAKFTGDGQRATDAIRDTAAAAREHDRRTFRAGAKWLIGNGSFHYTGRPGAWSPTDAEIDAALSKEGRSEHAHD